MRKNLIYIITVLLFTVPMFALVMTNMVSADSNQLLWDGGAGNFKSTTGLGERDPRDMAAQIIKVILGFVGIIAMVIILMGGFRWMVSGGNDDRINDAKKMIVSGAIGLIIVMASFGIARFVLNALYNATNATG